MNIKTARPRSFESEYWTTHFSKPSEMDTIGNRRQHCRYLHWLFKLEQIDINSVLDLGMGLGFLFDALLTQFKPFLALAIEPSKTAFNQAKTNVKRPSKNMKLKLLNTDIKSWCENSNYLNQVFDLGVCTSVMQYLDEDVLRSVIPVIARRVKFLYLTVPTDLEYLKLKRDTDFIDTCAYSRSQSFYFKLLKPHFTFISNRLLESKVHYDDMNSEFGELLYRF